MSANSTRVGGFRALGLGFGALRRNLSLFGFAISVDALVATCRAVLLFAAFAAAANRFADALGTEGNDLGAILANAVAAATSARLWIPAVCAWAAIELVGAVLRVVYLAAAVVDASARLKWPDRARLPVLAAAVGVLPRAIVASLGLVLLDVIGGLLRTALWLGAGLVLGAAFSAHRHGIPAAAYGALAVTLALLLALLIDLFGRVYRVRAIRHLEVSALEAAWDAGALLGRRLGTFVLIAVLGMLLAMAGDMLGGAPGAFAGTLGPEAIGVGLALRLAGSAFAAAWAAGLELVLVGAVCAVELDEANELPHPPPPPEPVAAQLVVPAQEVLVAQVIEPKPST